MFPKSLIVIAPLVTMIESNPYQLTSGRIYILNVKPVKNDLKADLNKLPN